MDENFYHLPDFKNKIQIGEIMQIKDIVAGKKYITKNGEEKTRWTSVGQLFIKDDGRMTVKFQEYINPMAFCNEKGEVWFNVFDKKEKEGTDRKEADPLPAKMDTNSAQVVAEGRKYAEQWKKQAEAQKRAKEHSLEEIEAAISAPDEQWFKENSEDIPF